MSAPVRSAVLIDTRIRNGIEPWAYRRSADSPRMSVRANRGRHRARGATTRGAVASSLADWADD